jgi:hypothetical protein
LKEHGLSDVTIEYRVDENGKLGGKYENKGITPKVMRSLDKQGEKWKLRIFKEVAE